MADVIKRPYWATIGYDGSTSTPEMISEPVFVPADNSTLYSFSATVEPTQDPASDVTLILNFYNPAGTSLLSKTKNLTLSAPGTATEGATDPVTAPANTDYVLAYIQWNNTPSTDNPLKVYDARVLNTNNAAQPPVLNQNYAFFGGFGPWTAGNNAQLNWYEEVPTTLDNPDFADSLVIDDVIELLGGPGGVESGVAELQDDSGNGAIFRIYVSGTSVTPGSAVQGPYDLGTPQPTQDVVESMLLDGERPYGDRSSNRTITLPVMIFAPSLKTMRAAREYLMRVIDQDSFSMTYTPADTGLPMVFDCFRATPSYITYGFNWDREAGNGSKYAMSLVTITIPALPFGRSKDTEQIDFTNGLIDGRELPQSVLADNFSTVQSMHPYTSNGHNYGNDGGWRKNTAMKAGVFAADGTNLMGVASAEYVPPTPMYTPWPIAYYRADFSSPVNVVGRPVFSMWFGQSYDSQWPKAPTWKSNVNIRVTLWDSAERSVSFNINKPKCPWGANSSKPVWTWLSTSIPLNNPRFDYTKVATYQINVSNNNGNGYVRMKAWLNGINFAPASIMWDTTPRGSSYTVKGKSYMARSPISAQLELPADAPSSVELTANGTWLVPTGVTSVQVETWGGGGAGGSASQLQAAGGGGGGEYAMETAVSVIPGTKVPVTIGPGGTAAQLVSTVKSFTNPGAQKWKCPAGVTTVKVETWGAGGAGGAGAGGGGGGQYVWNNTVSVTPGATYNMWVGKGGVANTGNPAGPSSRAGQGSWFGNSAATVGGNAILQARGGTSPLSGSTNGASGGATPVNGNSGTITGAYRGGTGGTSPGQAGGGGGAAAGPNGPGANGGNSPSTGNYKTGGKGGVGNGGGNGGAGANSPGTPQKGVFPGGGGGGGYTSGSNFIGANGANGQVKLTYAVGGGSPVNGGATSFGDVTNGLTNALVKANGGTSTATNSPSGVGGGSGSTNAFHYPGGAGGGGTAGTGGTDLNELIFGLGQATFDNLGTFSGTGTTFSSSASTTAESSGIALLVMVTSATMDAGHSITDSAGNTYAKISSVLISASGTAKLHVYRSAIVNPITTSTTISISGNATSVTYNAVWMGSRYFESILEDSIATLSGTGTSSTATYTNPVPGTNIMELVIDGNASSATVTGVSNGNSGQNPFGGITLFNSTAGTQNIGMFSYMAVGSSQGRTVTGTLSSSVPWARIAIPLAALNQETMPLQLARLAASAGTSTQPGPYGIPVDAGSGTAIVAVTAPAASTVSVSDSAGNTYTLLSSSSASGGVTKVFSAYITNQLTTAATWTVTDSVSQTKTIDVVFLPNVGAVDAATPHTNSGTGTSATITEVAPSSPNQYVIAVAGNGSGATYTTPSGWVVAGLNNNSGANPHGLFFKKQLGTTPLTFTTTQSASGAWNTSIAAFALTLGATSGGGGAAAGPQGPGRAAVGVAGGTAWVDGGKGANGAQGILAAGSSAGLPGGGGSGAISNGTTVEQGGAGGRGMVRVSWQPPLRAFNDFIIHRPAADTKARFLNPIVDIPPNDPPDNREYQVESTVSGVNAQFGGTYSVIVVNHAWDSPGSSRRISVTVNQYEYVNGPVVSTQCTKTVTPSTDITNGYVTMGEVTLPIKDYDISAAETYYTVSIHDTNGNDRFQDVLFIDSMGQTVLCNITPGSAGDGRYNTYYIDEPGSSAALGKILGTGSDRDRAISVLDMAMATGGPLYLEDADNQVVTYSTSGAPNLGITYSPRWYNDRLS